MTDVSLGTAFDITLTMPAGSVPDGAGVHADIRINQIPLTAFDTIAADDGSVTYQYGDYMAMVPGTYAVEFLVTPDGAGQNLTVPGPTVIVSDPTAPLTWYSSTTPDEQARLRGAWIEAPIANVEVCEMLLDVAKEQVLAYAPAPDTEAGEDWESSPPTRYVYAQLQQATNLWNAGRGNSDGEVGPTDYSFTPRPLDKTIRALIRPTSGVADVF